MRWRCAGSVASVSRANARSARSRHSVNKRELHPQWQRSRRQGNAEIRVAVWTECPIEADPHVVDQVSVGSEPIGLQHQATVGFRTFERRETVPGQAPRGFTKFSAGAQFFQRVSARRVEQTVVGLLVTQLGDDQRFGNEVGDVVCHQGGLDVPGDGNCPVHRELSGEHRQPYQHAGFRSRQ